MEAPNIILCGILLAAALLLSCKSWVRQFQEREHAEHQMRRARRFDQLNEWFDHELLMTQLEIVKASSELSPKLQALDLQQTLVEHDYETTLDFEEGRIVLTGQRLTKGGHELKCKHEFTVWPHHG